MSIAVKNRLLLILAATLAGPLALAAPARAQGTFQTSVPSAILVDYETGTILFEKDADKPMAPAALAKVMTAAVVFNQLKTGKLTMDTPFVVSVNAWRRGGGPSGGAAMFAEVNKPVRVQDLLSGMLVVSGNDAAITLAEGVANTEGEFANVMTETAKAIGMSNSTFRNATGFADAGQVSTSRDLATLARYVIHNYSEYYPIFSQPNINWNKIFQKNRNTLLDAGIGADGLQLGWLKEAGYNALGSAVQHQQRLIVAVLGAASEKQRIEETRRLVEWGFQAFRQRQLFAADQEVGRAQVFGGVAGSVGLIAGGAVTLLTTRAGNEKLTAKVTYRGPLRAPVAKGTKVGVLEINRGPAKILEVPLYAAADVEQGSLWERAMDGGFSLMGDTVRDTAKRIFAKH